jgi:S-adenosylmethionine/arginine decarboxylase-like enzyme
MAPESGSPGLPTGTTIRLLLLRCGCAEDRLTRHAAVAGPAAEAVRACEMVPLAQAGHDFPGAGHSLCLVLAESHLAIHTYPECSRSVVIELTVCDHQRNNRQRAAQLAEALVALFQPEETRGEVLPMTPAANLADR